MTSETLGIIAGEGKMPLYIARQAQQKGVRVVVLALKGNAREEDFRDVAAAVRTLRLGQVNTAFSFLKEQGAQKVLMPPARKSNKPFNTAIKLPRLLPSKISDSRA